MTEQAESVELEQSSRILEADMIDGEDRFAGHDLFVIVARGFMESGDFVGARCDWEGLGGDSLPRFPRCP